MLREHEEDVDDLEVRGQSANKDEDATMWSVTYDEDNDDDDDDWKYDYFQRYTVIIIILL